MARHRYHVYEPTRVGMNDSMLGTFEVSFDAGDVEPRSEQEELALAHLAANAHPDSTDERPFTFATQLEELPEPDPDPPLKFRGVTPAPSPEPSPEPPSGEAA